MLNTQCRQMEAAWSSASQAQQKGLGVPRQILVYSTPWGSTAAGDTATRALGVQSAWLEGWEPITFQPVLRRCQGIAVCLGVQQPLRQTWSDFESGCDVV